MFPIEIKMEFGVKHLTLVPILIQQATIKRHLFMQTTGLYILLPMVGLVMAEQIYLCLIKK